VNGNTVTFTRPLDATFFASVSLEKVAGCAAGDTATVPLVKP
jgi:hypothetical protein